jgi:predicted nucleotidyltransferase
LRYSSDVPPAASLPAAVESALERFAAAVRARFGDRVCEVTLFGSHARGDAHEDSDVDVLVVIADLTWPEHRETLDLAYRIDSSSDDLVGLSPIVYSAERASDLRARERRLLRDVDREGVPR